MPLGGINSVGKINKIYSKQLFPISAHLNTRFYEKRTIYVGDSAHSVHPIAGQGLNLGIRDVAALAEVLIISRRLGEDIGSRQVLNKYSKWRNVDVSSVVFFTDFANKIFSNDNYLKKFTTGLAFKLLNESKTIKNYLISEASGLSGDIPKLLKGSKL